MASDRVYPFLRIIWLPESLPRQAACDAQECGRVSDSPQDVDGKAKGMFATGLHSVRDNYLQACDWGALDRRFPTSRFLKTHYHLVLQRILLFNVCNSSPRTLKLRLSMGPLIPNRMQSLSRYRHTEMQNISLL
jgi:hypothetical protein